MPPCRIILPGLVVFLALCSAAPGQSPLLVQGPKSPYAPLPGAEPARDKLPDPPTPGLLKERNPEELPPHVRIEPDWYPSPPPAAYTTSACNFNVWCGEERFSPDWGTCQVLLGGYTSVRGLGPRIRDFTYIPVSVRYGWMLTAPQDTTGLWRGNFEFLVDFTVAGITSGYGHAFAGPSLLWRYNFVQPNATCIPYIQGGGLFVLTDAYRDKTQRAIGQAFEFYLRAEAGCRFMIADNLSLDLEGGFQHISNARLANRNLGVNALGGQIGLTYFFPSGGR